MPLNDPMVAAPLPLLQTPPLIVSVSATLLPGHSVYGPVIAVGEMLTVTVTVTPHPVPAVKVMMSVPVATPVTMPVPEPIVAIPVMLLAHTPATLSERVICAPMHTADGPPIAAGVGYTVTVVVR